MTGMTNTKIGFETIQRAKHVSVLCHSSQLFTSIIAQIGMFTQLLNLREWIETLRSASNTAMANSACTNQQGCKIHPGKMSICLQRAEIDAHRMLWLPGICACWDSWARHYHSSVVIQRNSRNAQSALTVRIAHCPICHAHIYQPHCKCYEM